MRVGWAELCDWASDEGVQQGDGFAMAAFCLALQPLLVACDTALGEFGELRAFADDVFVCCDATSAAAGDAIRALVSDAREERNLRWSEEKTRCYSPMPNGRVGWHAGFVDIPVGECDGCDGYGLEVMGAPVGDATYVADKLRAKAGSNVSKLDNLISMLRSRHLPALWCSVYYCMQPLLQHWLQLCPPASTREAAELLDGALKGAAAIDPILSLFA